ncbi:hypothetical protein [Duganella callida]|uniref:Uncharacterized protein n=1 Tax=Duganella callida TaxID=2561932 RepID=A0A4Y9S526_9BURK|nr:hypothetical protein [Duganella callida]TFW16438.1 hypothetical protein E4L98_23260 [Duganella callida]
MSAALQPTKEQVRAYMQRRQHEFCHRPPPMPEEIRRQLNWHYTPLQQTDHLSTSALFLPGAIVRLTTLLAVEWCFLAAGLGRPR